jgi:hypothetical protein
VLGIVVITIIKVASKSRSHVGYGIRERHIGTYCFNMHVTVNSGRGLLQKHIIVPWIDLVSASYSPSYSNYHPRVVFYIFKLPQQDEGDVPILMEVGQN